jgi:hypothetical protein
MAIQHRSIPDNELHEPKGAASAVTNTTYFSNGSGSGSWKKVGAETLKGLSGDSGQADRRILTTGDNGFKLVMDSAYANMQITNNSVPFPVTAAVDTTLNTKSQYVLLTGPGAPFASALSSNINFSTDRLTVTQNGIYELSCWANVSLFPSNTAKVALRFRINGSAVSDLKVATKSNSNGDYGDLVAFDFVHLNANDYIQLMVASDTTGNINFESLNLTINLIKAL